VSRPVPCIVCGKQLRDIGSGDQNHANDANSFRAHGQYGSTIFDPLDGSYLEVNICDSCITEAANFGRVLVSAPGVRDLKLWERDS
jgi:hypothetical protein